MTQISSHITSSNYTKMMILDGASTFFCNEEVHFLASGFLSSVMYCSPRQSLGFANGNKFGIQCKSAYSFFLLPSYKARLLFPFPSNLRSVLDSGLVTTCSNEKYTFISFQ